MIRYNRTAFLKFDTELNGNAFSRGPVTVNFSGTNTLALLFNDSAGLISRDNPVQTDDNGQYFFYIADGVYDIFINKDRVGEVVILDESISEVAIAPANEKVINSLTDLPTPIAGTITLEDNLVYVFGKPITTPDRFILGTNNTITSSNPQFPTLTYSGTGSMFTGVDVNLTVNNMRVICSTAQFLDLTSTLAGNTVVVDTVIVTSCEKFGTFDNLTAVDIINSASGDADDGMTFLGNTNWRILNVSPFFFATTSPTFIGLDLTTSLQTTININAFIVDGVPGAIGIKGEANSANLKPNTLGTVTNSEFLGGITPLSGVTLKDIRWDFKLNAGLSDSITDGILSIENNVVETVIATVDTPVKMTGTWTIEFDSGFTADTNGRLTFASERSRRLHIDVSSTLIMASGGSDKQVTAYIAINGTEVTQTGIQGTATSTKAAPLSMIWGHNFTSGDFVEVFIENNTDSVNIIGQQGILRL